MDYLPVFLRIADAPVLVVGGGRVAARKIEWLLKARARVTVVAPELLPELTERVRRGELSCLPRPFEPAQLARVRLVVAASDDPQANAAVSCAARERQIPVNVVDSAELSTFIFPAIIDRSPLVVAVSSAGAAPVLARRVREHIEALLPARLGALARFLGARRAAVAAALGALARRAFWERIVGGRAASQLLAGDEASAGRTFAAELAAARLAAGAATGQAAPGEVYLIGAGPGDPDLLTLRALQLLQQADVILHDRLVPESILERARRDAERIFVGKETGDHAQQSRINDLLVELARAGKRVARLKGGDPFIFGRGGEEAQVLAAHGIPYRVVPGITAALGAAAGSGIPLTHRRLAHSVTFVSGHAALEDTLDWRALARTHQTVVFYMGVAQLPRIVARLRAAGANAELPAAIVAQATLATERVLRAPLAAIATLALREQVAAPALLIVGEVTALCATGALAGILGGGGLEAVA
ncbi:MAG TPA: siroheme synthase CysG [Steroidobacteraceae bacterium]|nr:uroporphyrinogen-III C-methyltransferase [Gammaproteobacteria bacterium]HEV2286647.1 siroheme synthase CysG [Steroidobacteraceae bacterium]